MPSAEAHIPTGKASRYLAQLCQHAGKMGRPYRHRPRVHAGGAPPEIRHAEWSEIDGSLDLNWGQCTLHAGKGALILRACAPNEDDLTRVQDLLAARLERFGRREQLKVMWQPVEEYPMGV
jgi:hypothetical protein